MTSSLLENIFYEQRFQNAFKQLFFLNKITYLFPGHLSIVKLLLDAHANVEIQDEDGQTALHRSAIGGHIDVSKLLLDKEPKLKEIADTKDKIPFEYLAKNANDDFKILLKP